MRLSHNANSYKLMNLFKNSIDQNSDKKRNNSLKI